MRLDDGVFSDLPQLAYLDLSHNKQLILEPRGRTFHGVEDSLLFLGLSNISLLSVSNIKNCFYLLVSVCTMFISNLLMFLHGLANKKEGRSKNRDFKRNHK